MDVQVEPSSVLVLVRGSIQKHDLALIPALVRLANVGEIQRGSAERRVRRDARNTSFVSLSAVGWIAFIPNVDRSLLSLESYQFIIRIAER